MEIQVCADVESLAQAAVAHFLDQAQQAFREQGRGRLFSVALAGGSTPRMAYTLLAGSGLGQSGGSAPALDWGHVHIFWGDERCVPPDHPDSNYRMARQTLLDHVPIPEQNVHRMGGELPAEQAASSYEQTLRAFFTPSRLPTASANVAAQAGDRLTATFDLVLLGLGEDGHTASLFPGSPTLQIVDRWVAAVSHRAPPAPLVDRLTLTLPAINAARQVTFLVSGASKASRLRQVLQDDQARPSLPAGMVQPVNGNLLWLVDAAAAGELVGL